MTTSLDALLSDGSALLQASALKEDQRTELLTFADWAGDRLVIYMAELVRGTTPSPIAQLEVRSLTEERSRVVADVVLSYALAGAHAVWASLGEQQRAEARRLLAPDDEDEPTLELARLVVLRASGIYRSQANDEVDSEPLAALVALSASQIPVLLSQAATELAANPTVLTTFLAKADGLRGTSEQASEQS